MATKEEIASSIFEGDLPSGIDLPAEEVIIPKDFDMLGDEVITEDNSEESLQDDEVFEEEDTPSKGKKSSVVELLMQQNQLLQQQILSNGRNNQNYVNPEDQKALETGRALLNMQNQNPVLYGKLNSFLANELGGNQSNAQINSKLSALKDMLRSDKWKDNDVTPIMGVIEALELTENNTKKENQQLIQVINALQKDINGLKDHKENSARQAVEDRENKAIMTLRKAELEFGVKLKKGSEEAEDFVLLVQKGRDPRLAFMKAMGLKETDKVKRSSTKEVDLNPKVEPNKMTPARKIASQLFANVRRPSSLFKK